MLRLLSLCLLVCSSLAVANGNNFTPVTVIDNGNGNDYSSVLDGFFSLFKLPCEQWVTGFHPDAAFHHPKFPDGVKGTAELLSFCHEVRGNETFAAQQLFRSDGPPLLTKGVDEARLLVPYVYSAPPEGTDVPPFVNTGFESISVDLTTGLIKEVTEYFTANRLQ